MLLVYDDYKFVTKQELDSLGLSNLVGTNVLRAYMHGYFMDIRLYKKAKLITEPFNFEEFKQRKIKEKLDKERENRTKVINKLPQVNSELAKRLIEEKQSNDPKNKKNKVMRIDSSVWSCCLTLNIIVVFSTKRLLLLRFWKTSALLSCSVIPTSKSTPRARSSVCSIRLCRRSTRRSSRKSPPWPK